MKKLFVSQSNYIPWRGFFDAIHFVDEYIIYDDMQFSKNTFRNRNKIIGPNGPVWLTIPLKTKGRFGQKINEVEVLDSSWREKHWKTIELSYKKAPFFDQYAPSLKQLYLGSDETNLTQINKDFLHWVCQQLDISTPITDSRDYTLDGDRNERLVSLCQQTKSSIYCSSPTAKAYLDLELFKNNDIEVFFFDFTHYPPYSQTTSGEFHEVSALDVLFRQGPGAADLIHCQSHIR